MQVRKVLFPNASKLPGVYYILNLTNNKIYVGQSEHIQKRLGHHHAQLTGKRHTNPALQADWNIYGRSCFEFGILTDSEYLKTNQLIELEKVFIHAYKSNDPRYGYNKGRPTDHYAEKVRALAGHWNITSANYHDEVVRCCVDFAYQCLIEQEAINDRRPTDRRPHPGA